MLRCNTTRHCRSSEGGPRIKSTGFTNVGWLWVEKEEEEEDPLNAFRFLIINQLLGIIDEGEAMRNLVCLAVLRARLRGDTFIVTTNCC